MQQFDFIIIGSGFGGSVIPVNLGVNPSLTITALAERFSAGLAVKNEVIFNSRQIKFSQDDTASKS